MNAALDVQDFGVVDRTVHGVEDATNAAEKGAKEGANVVVTEAQAVENHPTTDFTKNAGEEVKKGATSVWDEVKNDAVKIFAKIADKVAHLFSS